ncbi:hypothetical protein ACJX0J_042006, partial [Zea mays]
WDIAFTGQQLFQEYLIGIHSPNRVALSGVESPHLVALLLLGFGFPPSTLDALYFLVVTAFFLQIYFSGAYSYVLFYANLLLLQLMHNFLFIREMKTQHQVLNGIFNMGQGYWLKNMPILHNICSIHLQKKQEITW